MVWARFLGPLRILGPLTKKHISRSTQKYQQEKSSDNYENKSLKSRESNPLTKYSKRYIPNQNLQVNRKF